MRPVDPRRGEHLHAGRGAPTIKKTEDPTVLLCIASTELPRDVVFYILPPPSQDVVRGGWKIFRVLSKQSHTVYLSVNFPVGRCQGALADRRCQVTTPRGGGSSDFNVLSKNGVLHS